VPVAGGPLKTVVSVSSNATVVQLAVSSDNAAVVFSLQSAGLTQLWVQGLTSTPDVQPQGDVLLLPAADLAGFAITPDGSSIVFSGAVGGIQGLYVVPLLGGTPVRLGDAGQVDTFQISPNSAWVAYLTDAGRLFGVGLDGQGRAELSPSMVAGGSAKRGFVVTKDAVVYRADARVDSEIELFVAMFGDGNIRRLSRKIADGGDVKKFSVSADGAMVAYTADALANNIVELFSVGVSSGRPVQLSGRLAGGGDVRGQLTIAPDSQIVVFRADAVTNGTFELFAVPIASGDRTKISAVLVPGGDVASRFVLSDDATRVVYAADALRDGRVDLF